MNECTCSAEPSPQVWFGKQEWFSHWQEIIADIVNNYYNYYEIILYVCVCITTYTPSPTSIRSAVLTSRLEEIRKQCCGFSHTDETKWVELKINSHGRKLTASSKL